MNWKNMIKDMKNIEREITIISIKCFRLDPNDFVAVSELDFIDQEKVNIFKLDLLKYEIENSNKKNKKELEKILNINYLEIKNTYSNYKNRLKELQNEIYIS